MTVYLDLVMLLNFLVDFLLLLGTNKLSGFPPDPMRAAVGGVIGAVYSGVCLLPSFRFLSSLLWRTVFLGLMAAVAFGWNRSAIKRAGVFPDWYCGRSYTVSFKYAFYMDRFSG